MRPDTVAAKRFACVSQQKQRLASWETAPGDTGGCLHASACVRVTSERLSDLSVLLHNFLLSRSGVGFFPFFSQRNSERRKKKKKKSPLRTKQANLSTFNLERDETKDNFKKAEKRRGPLSLE